MVSPSLSMGIITSTIISSRREAVAEDSVCLNQEFQATVRPRVHLPDSTMEEDMRRLLVHRLLGRVTDLRPVRLAGAATRPRTMDIPEGTFNRARTT